MFLAISVDRFNAQGSIDERISTHGVEAGQAATALDTVTADFVLHWV